MSEADSLLCQQIQCGSSDLVVSKAVNVVGAQSIEGNKKNAGTGFLVRFRLAGNAGTSG